MADTKRNVAGASVVGKRYPSAADEAVAFLRGAQKEYTGDRAVEVTQAMMEQRLPFESETDATGIPRMYAPRDERRAAELAAARADYERQYAAAPEAFEKGSMLAGGNIAAAIAGLGAMTGPARPLVEAALYSGQGAMKGSAHNSGTTGTKGALMGAGISGLLSSLPYVGRVAGNWLKGTSGADVRMAQELIESASAAKPGAQVVHSGSAPSFVPSTSMRPTAPPPAGAGTTAPHAPTMPAPPPVDVGATIPAPVIGRTFPAPSPNMAHTVPAPATEKLLDRAAQTPFSRRPTVSERVPEIDELAATRIPKLKEMEVTTVPETYREPATGQTVVLDLPVLQPVKPVTGRPPAIIGEGSAAQRAAARRAKAKK